MSYYNRVNADQYFTPISVANKIAILARTHADSINSDGSNFIEPAAGRGDIMNALFRVMRTSDSLMAVEIDSLLAKKSGSMQCDFLQWESPIQDRSKNIVVGNPPYRLKGLRYASKAFINHASTFANTIIFIVPASLHRPASQNRVERSLHLIYEESLGIVKFITTGKSSHKEVHVYLQVWQRKECLREIFYFEQESEHFTLPYRTSSILQKHLSDGSFVFPDVIVNGNGSHHQVGVKYITDHKLMSSRLQTFCGASAITIDDFLVYLKNGVTLEEFLDRIELRRNEMFRYVKSVHSFSNSYNMVPQEFIRLYDHGLEKMWTNL